MAWATREQPILDAIARLSEDENPRWEDVQRETGLSTRAVQQGLKRLYAADYITGLDATGGGDTFYLLEIELLERGLVATGTWPGDAYEELIASLRSAIEAEANPVEKTKLERLRDAAIDVGKDVTSAVLTSVIKSATGLP